MRAVLIGPVEHSVVQTLAALAQWLVGGLVALNYSGSNWVAGEVGCVRNLSITCATSGAWPRL